MKLKNLSYYSCLTDILMYSAIGCCSYLLLIVYGNIPAVNNSRLETPEAIMAVLLLFNGIGLSLRLVNKRMGISYPILIKKRCRLFGFMAATAVALLISNYLLLIVAKLIIHSPFPFVIAWRGMAGLIGVWLIELIAVSLFLTNKFYGDIEEQHRRTKLLEESSAQAQYTALQSQLNPHFLFNCLNTLIAEIEYNPSNAAEFTRNMADAYRYILDCHDKQAVCLNEEMEFAQTYLQLQRVRLGNCIHIDSGLKADEVQMRLPPLTLQLLTENVIKHNTVSITDPMSIKIWCEKTDDRTWLAVSNRLKPKLVKASPGKGLQNLSKRCRLMCGQDIKIIKDNKCFTVKIPLIYD